MLGKVIRQESLTSCKGGGQPEKDNDGSLFGGATQLEEQASGGKTFEGEKVRRLMKGAKELVKLACPPAPTTTSLHLGKQ